MKTKERGSAADTKRERQTITFQPIGGALEEISEWDKTGYDRTILLNTLLTKYGSKARKELPSLLAQLGILPKSEPLTPTSHNARTMALPQGEQNKKLVGVVAQLAERVNGIHEVGGSIPPGSTKTGKERVRLGGYVDKVHSRRAMSDGGKGIISRSE